MLQTNYVKPCHPHPSPAPPSNAALGKAMSQTHSVDEGGKKKPEIVVAVASYTSGGSEQISFSKGDMVLVKKKTDTGWWEGELQAKGKAKQVGWFPASYVKSMGGTATTDSGANTPAADKGRTDSVSSAGTVFQPIRGQFGDYSCCSDTATLAGIKVVALYDYAAMNPDELSFKKNDVITIVSKEDDNWWKGVLHGNQGILPSNYVHIAN